MNQLLIGLLSALVATNQAATVSNLVTQTTGITVSVPDPNDPVEKEFQKLLAEDDAAQVEVDSWLQTEFKKVAGDKTQAPVSNRLKMEQRFEPVRKSYEDFLAKHPSHTRALLAYGSFLGDTGHENEAVVQWEKARESDPKNPAAWNNLANYYGHNGPVTNAFACYARAIELNPREAIYYQNFATTVYLFRKDAMSHYRITEPEVFDKAMGLYKKALEADPNNFIIASDLAQSYYGIRLKKTADADANLKAAQKQGDEAIAAWNTTLKLARDEIERQGVIIHIARWQINLKRYDEAQKNLDAVTEDMYATVKARLAKKMGQDQGKIPLDPVTPPEAKMEAAKPSPDGKEK